MKRFRFNGTDWLGISLIITMLLFAWTVECHAKGPGPGWTRMTLSSGPIIKAHNCGIWTVWWIDLDDDAKVDKCTAAMVYPDEEGELGYWTHPVQFVIYPDGKLGCSCKLTDNGGV